VSYFELERNISIELLDPAMAKDVFKLIDNNRHFLSQWLSWPAFTKKPSDFESFALAQQQLFDEGKGMTFIIRFHDHIVGVAGFNEIIQDRQLATVGYWLAEHAQGKGIITTVCRELIRIAFEDLNLSKVQLSAAEHNVSSRRVAERLGMAYEGCISHAENVNGNILSHAVYGLLKPTADVNRT